MIKFQRVKTGSSEENNVFVTNKSNGESGKTIILRGSYGAEDAERFSGFLVKDYSSHHHLDILGSILMLSPNLAD